MRQVITLWVLSICCLAARAQRTVQTIVPVQPVAVGAAFQVQYIVTGNEPPAELQAPAFGNAFRFVSGPRMYDGEALINQTKTPIRNYSYTLIPLRKGHFPVKGATAVFDNGKITSTDVFVDVRDAVADSITATPLSYLPRLAPGPALPAALQQHLFVQTSVSRQSCFIGEPVVATFTLFSRLPSASEVVKNPGFYGFSVLDVPGAEGQQAVQTHNGLFYNTHVLRKVQLYPSQTGSLVLDNLSVANAIEYTDSATGATARTTVMLESKPVTVIVKPLPEAPPQFSGGVGTFSIRAFLDKASWRQNSNGTLKITLAGAGNFVQVSPPEIQWPKGVDVFEAKTTERMQKEVVPVTGTRTYTFNITADSAGRYSIPAIAFTYFNSTTKKFETTTTDNLSFEVQPVKKIALLPPGIRKQISTAPAWWLLVLILITGSALFWWLQKKRFGKKDVSIVTNVASKPLTAAQRIAAIEPGDPFAYRNLQQVLMEFLKTEPKGDWKAVTASTQSIDMQQELEAIRNECEAVQYYNAAPTVPFATLQQQALRVVQRLQPASTRN